MSNKGQSMRNTRHRFEKERERAKLFKGIICPEQGYFTEKSIGT